MKRLDQLIGRNYCIRKYKDLTREYQLAIAFYMAIDGEAWEALPDATECDFSKDSARDALVGVLQQYVDRYAETRWGVVTLPVDSLIQAIAKDPEIAPHFRSWEDYAAWYRDNCASHEHPTTNLWPVILSSTDDETLQDGWHRLHSYVHAGVVEIPAVFYPDDIRHPGLCAG